REPPVAGGGGSEQPEQRAEAKRSAASPSAAGAASSAAASAASVRARRNLSARRRLDDPERVRCRVVLRIRIGARHTDDVEPIVACKLGGAPQRNGQRFPGGEAFRPAVEPRRADDEVTVADAARDRV